MFNEYVHLQKDSKKRCMLYRDEARDGEGEREKEERGREPEEGGAGRVERESVCERERASERE